MANTFLAYPPWFIKITKTLFPSVTAGFIVFLLVRERFDFDAAVVTLILVSCSLLLFLGVDEKVIVDDEKIARQSPIHLTALKWSEIDDCYSSPRVLSIRSASKNKRIRIFGGTNPNGFPYYEQLDELQREVEQRVGARLAEKWSQLNLPLTFAPPGLAWRTIAGYSVPFSILLFYFALFVMKFEGLLLEKGLFFLIGMLILIPFFVRDYKRHHKKLVLDSDGIHQMNGKKLFVPWQEITAILMKESALGSDSITVQHKLGDIFIPLSQVNSGQMLHVIRQRTTQPITCATFSLEF